MVDLPVMLKIGGCRCVVIGGGAVAARRVGSLLEAGARVTLISPQVHESLDEQANLTIHRRAYRQGDLAGARLVVIASDDPQANIAAADEAKAAGVLVNRADDPEQGDLAIPAHAHHGPVTLAVHTSGISATASAAIRRELSASLASHWPSLLAAVAPWRARIQGAIHDPADRRRRLAALVDEQALALWRQGGQAALEARLKQLADPQCPCPQVRVARESS